MIVLIQSKIHLILFLLHSIYSKETYKKEIITKTVVKDYLENTDDILARIVQHPTVTNAKIADNMVQVDITFEIIAEIIGETKMKVTVFKELENWEEEIDTIDMDINENFLG